MPRVRANGIDLEYETTGDPTSPPVVLIQGFSLQMTHWDPRFLEALAQRGYYVIAFDNRDVGLSTWLDGTPDGADGTPAVPYSISDMADDTVGLLDALGVASAHLVGYSMGGMIAQTMAIEYPKRVLTLASVSSNTGAPGHGQVHPEVLDIILTPVAETRAASVDKTVEVWRAVSSPGYLMDEDALRAGVAAGYDRANHPTGIERQFIAIMTQPDRSKDLALVSVPTLVVHGDSDRMVDPSGGIATASAVPGAKLTLVPGWGHDLHPELFDQLVDELVEHFERG